ncbi:Rfe UDP-N-acetylmuramyl pentapeptide phosphotransferase/UDP-N- acetylglucosamine-1-phosphate transferase [Candidatus Pelagibacterales bacterium]
MQSILIILLSTSLLFFLNFFFKKKSFLIDNKSLSHKSFTSKKAVPLSGGSIIFFNLALFSNNYFILFFFFLIFILGIFSDLLIITKPLQKFIIQFLVIFFFLNFLDLKVLSTKIYYIDFLIKNKLFAILFSTFCLLILINGTNFIDGINTLVCGYYILIILTILYVCSQNKLLIYNFDNFYYLFLSLLVIYFFNYSSKVYLGDSGSFLVSFLTGYYLINFCNDNLNLVQFISPIFILLLLWYPAFENLFSIIRKIISKKNPSEPDNMHLHHLLFYFLKKKNKKTFICNNTLAGSIINSYNLISFAVASKFYYHTEYLTYITSFNVLFYVAVYFYFYKKIKKFNNFINIKLN